MGGSLYAWPAPLRCIPRVPVPTRETFRRDARTWLRYRIKEEIYARHLDTYGFVTSGGGTGFLVGKVEPDRETTPSGLLDPFWSPTYNRHS